MLRSPLRTRRAALVAALAASVAGCNDNPSEPPMDPEPVGAVAGTVRPLGALDPSGTLARVRWGAQEAVAEVAADGTFSVPLMDSVSGFGFLTLEPGPATDLHPAWILLSPGDLGGRGTVVLLPKRWTIQAGDYAGQVVAIDPTAAADARVLPAFWGSYFLFEQEGLLQTVVDRRTWLGFFRSWPPDAFPIPVALDRIGSDAPFTAPDSVLFWTHVDRMEAALGRDLFRPAPLGEMEVLGGTRRARNGVLVQWDGSLGSAAVGVPDEAEPWIWTLAAQAGAWSGGVTERIEFVSADLGGGRIELRDAAALGNRQQVIHQLMHLLGAGHGCSWPSVQTYCASLLSDVPTAQDVAHLEVLEAARAFELATSTRWGLFAGIVGHRAVTRGLPPVPALELVYGPANAPGPGR